MPWQDLELIRSRAPLVHNITNFVVMNSTANALLALGAAPVMAHAPEEVEEFAAVASALVLNIGTLSAAWVEAMVKAGAAARRRGIPVVLDPVGCGATRYRTETSLRLLREVGPTIVRGNASEIAALAGAVGATKGVDSTLAVEAAVAGAVALAEQWHCAVAVSGPVDVIVGGGEVLRVHNGHPLMPRVTGLGCTASALCGAFAAVNGNPARAAAHALVVTGLAGEMAAAKADGPGTLQLHFLDALYRLTPADVRERGRLVRA